MKKIVLISVAMLACGVVFGQELQEGSSYVIGARYHHEFVMDGYVRVREWDLHGDKMKLKDLGMTSYSAFQLNVEKHLKRGRSLALVYDQYFMTGTATFDRNIIYNGTIINGRNGVNVSPTRYFRISTIFTAPLASRAHFDLQYTVGLVVDHITFYVAGEVDPSSPKDEVLEGFGKQAFPYPLIGLKGSFHLNGNNNICWRTSGTYIPTFRSFYREGGNVHLQYSNFEADVNYSRTISKFQVSLGANLRYMYLFQESHEDTNVINTITAGPYLGMTYRF